MRLLVDKVFWKSMKSKQWQDWLALSFQKNKRCQIAKTRPKPAGRSLTRPAGFRPIARVRPLAVAHSLHALHWPWPGGEDEEICIYYEAFIDEFEK